MKKITKKNSYFYNQLWIDKAIEDGHMEFIPIHRLPNKSIGEHIELKYKQLYGNTEFNKHYYNGTIDDYYHIVQNNPKITKKNSLLFAMEWILKFKEEELPIQESNKDYSLGEVLEIYYKNNVENRDLPNSPRKKVLKNEK